MRRERRIGQAVRQSVDLAASLLLAPRLSAREAWTRAELLAHQRRSFLAMVRHAREASPFYRDLYRGIDFGGEIASWIGEHLFDSLDAPVRRIGATDTPVGYAPDLEYANLPQVDRIAAALKDLARY